MHGSSIIKAWVPLAVVIVGFGGLLYITVQQSYRTALNDPQIQIAEDASRLLASGADPASFIPQNKIDIATSLAPYIVIYDENLKPVAWSGTLNGESPKPPAGVFDAAKTSGQNRISWQPEPDVRSAIIINYYQGSQSGYVLVGRSMREVEIRVANLSRTITSGMAVLLAGTLILQFLLESFLSKKKLLP